MSASAEALEVAQRVTAHEHDIAAAAAIAPVGSALGHVGFTAERQAAVTATDKLADGIWLYLAVLA